MKTPLIPNNSLKVQITEIVNLCKKLASDYGDEASWFQPPASEAEISDWENKTQTLIPKTYKEWLSFTSEANIRNTLAHFYSPNNFIFNLAGLPEDYVYIADLNGDGEILCFSKTTGDFIWIDHKNEETLTDFSSILDEVIRMLKPQSCLSPEMEKLLMDMVKQSDNKK